MKKFLSIICWVHLGILIGALAVYWKYKDLLF